ncbi:MAG: C40 family peptidase [Coriobacteriia bacterium]
MWRLHQEAGSLKSILLRAVIGPLLILMTVLGVAQPSFAAPIAEKRAEATRIAAQVEELDTQLEIAAEDYNEARSAHDAVRARIAENEVRAGELAARQDQLEANLSTRARGMYRQGPLGVLEVLLGSTSFQEFAATWDLLQDMNDNDASRVAELKATRAELRETLAELDAQQAEAATHADLMHTRKGAVEAQLAERQRLLAGVEAEIAEIIRQQAEARRRAAATAAAAKRAQSRPATDFGNPTSAPRSQVVPIALSKLGTPYRWAASGPGSFDCSGFTMWVYAQVGVSLPHSSRSQIGVGQRVSREKLAPGDLVFFGRSRIHHVGIYIGGGDFVHAPSTGGSVKVTSLDSRGDYVGACRP